MVDSKIFQIAEELKGVVAEQMEQAQKALVALPEGETKDSLKNLLKKASSGKVSYEDAQRELNQIIQNAR